MYLGFFVYSIIVSFDLKFIWIIIYFLFYKKKRNKEVVRLINGFLDLFNEENVFVLKMVKSEIFYGCLV